MLLAVSECDAQPALAKHKEKSLSGHERDLVAHIAFKSMQYADLHFRAASARTRLFARFSAQFESFVQRLKIVEFPGSSPGPAIPKAEIPLGYRIL
jgi:hypothetical protein